MDKEKLLLMISERILRLYKLHDYEVRPDVIAELAVTILEKEPKITTEYFNDFAKRVMMGEYGTLYRMPTSLMSMLHSHLKVNRLSYMMP